VDVWRKFFNQGGEALALLLRAMGAPSLEAQGHGWGPGQPELVLDLVVRNPDHGRWVGT